MTDSKWCRRCDTTKPRAEFHRSRTARDGLTTYCKACMRAYQEANRAHKLATQADWYQRNRERLIAAQQARYQANPDAVKQRAAQWRRDHHALALEREAERRAADRERFRATQRRWAERNAATKRARSRVWFRAHPHKAAEYQNTRRARKLNAPRVERIDRQAIIERDASMCHICGLFVPPDQMSLDHVIPLARGGAHTADNLKVAHRRCNSRKNATLPRSAGTDLPELT